MLGGKPNLRSKLYKVRTIMHNKILDFFLGGDATVRPKIGPVYRSEINCMIYNQKLFD